MNEDFYDVIVIGGGPSGLTAGIYLARARYRVLIIEKEKFGGQITITANVVNYPGIGSIGGTSLTEAMRDQAKNFGAEFLLSTVENVDTKGDIKTVKAQHKELKAFGIIIATGAHPRKIGFKGELEFAGHGVAYCATCDGEFFTGLDVFVIGGGFAAAEEAVFLTKYARKVTILVREEDFTCAKAVADTARNHPKIEVFYNTILEEIGGDSALEYAYIKNIETGQATKYTPPPNETFGVFVFAGYEPDNELVKDIIKLDEQGYIITDKQQKTNIDGIYAAGDICVKNLRQVVTAVSDGAIAATELEKYVSNMQQKTGIYPKPITKAPEQSNQSENQEASNFFTSEINSQLEAVFSKMEQKLVLNVSLDDRPVSNELKAFLEEIKTDKLIIKYLNNPQEDNPCIRVFNEKGEDMRIAFHGVPGGHEFNSFIIGLYNAAGPGQQIEADILQAIKSINSPIKFKILVSLSCTMCPELVMAAQHIALQNPLVHAEAYDLNHFPELKNQYKIMSVPCLVVNDQKVYFGKKNIRQLVDLVIEYN